MPLLPWNVFLDALYQELISVLPELEEHWIRASLIIFSCWIVTSARIFFPHETVSFLRAGLTPAEAQSTAPSSLSEGTLLVVMLLG